VPHRVLAVLLVLVVVLGMLVLAPRGARPGGREPQPPAAGIELRVVDASGQPIPGARVLAGSQPRNPWSGFRYTEQDWDAAEREGRVQEVVRTDATGRASFRHLPPDQWTLLAACAPGTARHSLAVRTPLEGDVVDAGAQVLAAGRQIQVAVRTTDGEPIAEALVEVRARLRDGLYPEEEPPDRDFSALTGPDGIATLGHVPFGELHVVARKAGYLPGEGDVPDGEEEVVLELAPGTTVRGRILDQPGAPVAGARVLVLEPWPEVRRGNRVPLFAVDHLALDSLKAGVPTGEDGVFVCRGFAPDQEFHLVVFDPPNFLASSPVHSAGTAPVFRLPLRHEVTAVLAAPHTDPGRIEARLWPVEDPGRSPSWTGEHVVTLAWLACAGDGSFACRVLPGRYWLEARFPGGRYRWPDVLEVHTDLDLGRRRVPAGTRVRLRVTDVGTGVPLADVEGFRIEPGTDVPGRRAGVPGVLEWTAEPPGERTYVARAPGHVPGKARLSLETRVPVAETVLALERSASLVVTLTDPDGSPVAGAALALAPEANLASDPGAWNLPGPFRGGGLERETGPDGRAWFPELVPGSYEVRLRNPAGYRDRFFLPPAESETVPLGRVRVEGGERGHLRLVLRRPPR